MTLLLGSMKPLISNTNLHESLKQNSNKYKFIILIVLLTTFFGFSFVKAEEVNPDSNTSSTLDTTTTTATTTIPDVIFATTTINLTISTFNNILFSNNYTVTECPINENSTTTKLTVYCALQQIAKENNWDILFNDSGGKKFLSKINQYDGTDYNWWAFFHNLDFANEALNEYPLKENDKIILSYGIFPLKIEVSTSTPEINTTTTIRVKEFGFDMSWNSAWLDSPSNTILVNNNENFSTNGTLDLLINTTTPYKIKATKNSFIPTDEIEINPTNTITTPTTSTPPTEEPVNEDGNGNGGSYLPTYANLDVEKAIQYLNTKQQNGDFSSILHTDWAAIAFGAYNRSNPTSVAIKNYLLTDPPSAGGANSVSDFARRAMALMALNINPYQTKTNYLKKITDTFNGTELVDIPENQGLFNDDIFALIPLYKAGYSEQDEIIKKIIAFVLSKQTNSNWGSIDLTAAAIQALKPFSANSEISKAITDATTYLKTQQQTDGSFSENSFSTSWSIQAGDAMGESNSDWIKKAKDYLSKQQQTDGSVENDVWATTQVIPATLNKPWNDILINFSKPQENGGGSAYILPIETSNTTPTTTTAATTTVTTTTTIQLVTSSLILNITTTTTSTTTNNTQLTTNNNTPKENNYQIADNKNQRSKDHITSTAPPINNNTVAQWNNVETLSPASPSSTTNNPAKTVFGISLTAASGLGLFLAWKLLQTLV